MKPYLLVAGYRYYPSSHTDDWIACYETKEQAEKRWNELTQNYDYDWHEIVDLMKWIEE